ncbi:MAG: MBL fold metallo-hydrolase, partial [Alistipes sp.]|nr:MBL fold metallo-hydrolase [Alistipes sp.]
TTAATLLATSVEGLQAKGFAAMTPPSEGLQVRFLGTGAADWKGRDERGEHRRLSSILLDDSIFIDLTATNLEMIPAEAHPETIFYTHSHGDHYHPASALRAGVKRVYLGQTWYDIAKADFQRAATQAEVPMPEIIPLYVGQKVNVGDVAITPLPASHATGYQFEQTLMYLIEKQGVRLIYATDTGGIPAVAARLAGIDAHEKPGNPITALIMEATMGIGYDDDFRSFTHTSVAGVERIVRVLEKTKRYIPTADQPVYLTHMARTLHGTQAELDRDLPKPLRAARDGEVVIFKTK